MPEGGVLGVLRGDERAASDLADARYFCTRHLVLDHEFMLDVAHPKLMVRTRPNNAARGLEVTVPDVTPS